ncbi:MAG: hypothetical protein WC389_19320 [Lutibacter sp.]
MTDPTVTAWLEAFKEGGRLVLLATLPTIVAGLSLTTGEITVNWLVIRNLAIVEAIVFILKMIDKGKFTYSKDTKKLESDDSNGLVPF